MEIITSFKHKGLREFFETNSKRGIPPKLSTRLRDRLDVLDAATTFENIALPHFGLHELKGDRERLPEVMAGSNRRYARRQLRWLRRDPRITWFDAADDPVPRILEFLRDRLS